MRRLNEILGQDWFADLIGCVLFAIMLWLLLCH